MPDIVCIINAISTSIKRMHTVTLATVWMEMTLTVLLRRYKGVSLGVMPRVGHWVIKSFQLWSGVPGYGEILKVL